MKVAIVGAGTAGLACARTLVDAGHEAVVFEKSRGFGGRVTTRRKDGFVWDTGAGYIEAEMLPHLPPDGLTRIDKPVWVVGEDLTPRPDRETGPRYAYVGGNNSLGKGLAAGLTIHRETRIESLVPLRNEYDAVVLTAPIPQTRDLLATVSEARDLGEVAYRSCLAVALGYEGAAPDVPYVSLMARDLPLGWLSLESTKCPGRAPEGCCSFVAQLGETFSVENYAVEADDLIALAAGYVQRLYGLECPIVSDVMRWRFSQPTVLGDFDKANPPDTRILVASDGLTGGKIHHAYAAGLKAAQRLIEGG